MYRLGQFIGSLLDSLPFKNSHSIIVNFFTKLFSFFWDIVLFSLLAFAVSVSHNDENWFVPIGFVLTIMAVYYGEKYYKKYKNRNKLSDESIKKFKEQERILHSFAKYIEENPLGPLEIRDEKSLPYSKSNIIKAYRYVNLLSNFDPDSTYDKSNLRVTLMQIAYFQKDIGDNGLNPFDIDNITFLNEIQSIERKDFEEYKNSKEFIERSKELHSEVKKSMLPEDEMKQWEELNEKCMAESTYYCDLLNYDDKELKHETTS